MSSSNCCFLACIQISQELQLCPTLWDPMDCTRLFCPWDSPGKNTGVVCHFLLPGDLSALENEPLISYVYLLCQEGSLPLAPPGEWGYLLQEGNYLFICKMESINKLWKILKEMGIPAHLTHLLRNLYASQEATVRTGHGTDWFQIGKGAHQGCILSPCSFNLYAEYIMRNAGLDEAQAGIKIARRNINNLRYADDTTLMPASEEELKSLLMKVKGERVKSWLKTQHSKNEDHGIRPHHFMANRWGENGNSDRLLFSWAPKSLQVVSAAMKLKDTYSLEEKLWPT